MTVPPRVVARLDVKGPNVIKGIHLEGVRVVGDPAEMARTYYKDGVDEIIFIDAVASLYGRNNLFEIVEEVASQVFVPLTVCGGIRTLDDIKKALRSGADKVGINTAAVERPEFLREAAQAFGSQCIVLSLEVRQCEPGKWEVLVDCGRERTGRDLIEWVQEASELGIGEILLTSVDRDGTREGYDLELIEAVSNVSRLPLIASGGAGQIDHVVDVAQQGCADAFACATILHYDVATLSDVKQNLKTVGISIREDTGAEHGA